MDKIYDKSKFDKWKYILFKITYSWTVSGGLVPGEQSHKKVA